MNYQLGIINLNVHLKNEVTYKYVLFLIIEEYN